MNKSIFASILIPVLLAGCGSSGGSSSSSAEVPATPVTPTPPPPPITYQWQVVQLRSVDKNSLDERCVIYGDSKNDEVISAYIAETGYNILYHNADGSIATTIAADEIRSGRLTIAADDVPDNGYVSLEELSSTRGGSTGSYMFSVQKSLLSDMVVNISLPQISGCYAGSDHRKRAASGTAKVNVNQPSSAPAYYQSSYDIDSVNGQITVTGIQVNSPYPAAHDTLITAFDSYDSNTGQKKELSYWAFIDAEKLYEDGNDDGFSTTTGLSNADLSSLYWQTSDTISLDSDSGIIALHEGNSYFWQPIYNDSDKLTLAYGSSEVSNWSGYFSGKETVNSWSFNRFMPLTDSNVDITLPSSLSTVNSNSINVSSSCSVAADYCIDTGDSFSGSDFNYQRTHIRIIEDNNIFYQSIYSKANAEPVVLANSQFDFITPTLDRIEFNLMSSDADSSDAVQYLMVKNIDLVSVGKFDSNNNDNAADTNFYSDINGYISTAMESEKLYQAMLASSTYTVKNAYKKLP